MRVAQGVLDGQLHIGQPQLRFDGPIFELHAAVYDALRVHHDLDLVHAHIEQPLGFDDLEAFVHHGRAVDGDFGAHVPVGVLQCLCLRDAQEFFSALPAEWTS